VSQRFRYALPAGPLKVGKKLLDTFGKCLQRTSAGQQSAHHAVGTHQDVSHRLALVLDHG
jgi:hypothetical protein